MFYDRVMYEETERHPPGKGWSTAISHIGHNRIEIAGHAIGELVGERSLPEVVHLLFQRAFPDAPGLQQLRTAAYCAAGQPLPRVAGIESEDVSRTIARSLLADQAIAQHPAEGKDGECVKTAFSMGRVLLYIDSLLRGGKASGLKASTEPLSHWLYRVFTDEDVVHAERARMLEALVVACIDHGFTPPSTQICVLAASTRVRYEVALALSVAAISDFHGGASGRSAEFFLHCRQKVREQGMGDVSMTLAVLIGETLSRGKRIPGLGHRIHTSDPRCEALWRVAEETGVAGQCVHASKVAPSVLSRIAGKTLPINVDGVIGAIIADMGLPPVAGTMLFLLGRVAGLSAHYFEEVSRFSPMRWIDFGQAGYRSE
jgi:citrate synthase